MGHRFRGHHPLMLLADGLGATIDEFLFDRQVAANSFDTEAGSIAAGTVSAQRFSCTAVVNGRPALTVEHIARLGDDQAPDWPAGRGWHVTVEGSPSMELASRIATHGEDETEQGCLDIPIIAGRGVLAG